MVPQKIEKRGSHLKKKKKPRENQICCLDIYSKGSRLNRSKKVRKPR